VWDAATGTSLAELKGHTRRVRSAAFSPDGARIVTASEDKTARVWESVPYRERYPAIAAMRATRARVAAPLAARINAGTDLAALTKSLVADAALSAVDRTAAMAIVQEERDRRAAVTHALNYATKAASLDPVNADIINTLGVAQYRAGKFEDALTTLARSTALYCKAGTSPLADLAFIAMAHFKLGHVDEARAALASLRQLMTQKPHSANAESQGFLREAEALIEPGSCPKK